METQTDALSTATSVTVPCSDVDAVIRSVAGSIFTTRPFSPLATQTALPEKTIEVAASGVPIRRSTCPSAGSTRTVWAPRATHTEPAPNAIPVGLACQSPLTGTENVRAILPVAGSRPTSPGAVVLGDPGRTAARGDAPWRERQLRG